MENLDECSRPSLEEVKSLHQRFAEGRAAEEDGGAAMQVKNPDAEVPGANEGNFEGPAAEGKGEAMQVNNTIAITAGPDVGICSRSRAGTEVSSLVDCSNSEPK